MQRDHARRGGCSNVSCVQLTMDFGQQANIFRSMSCRATSVGFDVTLSHLGHRKTAIFGAGVDTTAPPAAGMTGLAAF